MQYRRDYILVTQACNGFVRTGASKRRNHAGKLSKPVAELSGNFVNDCECYPFRNDIKATTRRLNVYAAAAAVEIARTVAQSRDWSGSALIPNIFPYVTPGPPCGMEQRP